jgi:riboflavin biosynthesis pyrimidine reductase
VVEGGATLLNHLIANNYWNEAIVFYSPKNISNGIEAPTISGKIIQQDNIDVIQMTQYLNL